MKYLIFFFIMLAAEKSYSQEFSNPKSLFDPQPYGFSYIAKTPVNSVLVFIAGQGGEENREGDLSPDFRRQMNRALRNIQEALRSQRLDMQKITTLVVDHDPDKLRILIEEFQKVCLIKNFL